MRSLPSRFRTCECFGQTRVVRRSGPYYEAEMASSMDASLERPHGARRTTTSCESAAIVAVFTRFLTGAGSTRCLSSKSDVSPASDGLVHCQGWVVGTRLSPCVLWSSQVCGCTRDRPTSLRAGQFSSDGGGSQFKRCRHDAPNSESRSRLRPVHRPTATNDNNAAASTSYEIRSSAGDDLAGR